MESLNLPECVVEGLTNVTRYEIINHIDRLEAHEVNQNIFHAELETFFLFVKILTNYKEKELGKKKMGHNHLLLYKLNRYKTESVV